MDLKASFALHFITSHMLVLFLSITAVIYEDAAPIIIPATAPLIIRHLQKLFIKNQLLVQIFWLKNAHLMQKA